MLCACIDIGSNTTRVLVADVADGRLRPVVQRKAFTSLGHELRRDGRMSESKITLLVDVVRAQREAAEAAGAVALRAVATAAVRCIEDCAQLRHALAQRAGVELELLTPDDEARLAFLGATRTLAAPLTGTIAVVDVGGGSSEVAVGTFHDGVRRAVTYPIGSGVLVDEHPCDDPPTAAQIAALRSRVADALDPAADTADTADVAGGRVGRASPSALLGGVAPAPPDHALAVGGSATSLCRLVGERLTQPALDAALQRLAAAPAAELARVERLEPQRVRLLPAGIVLLEAIVERLRAPLVIGRGGLREGVCLELASGMV